MVTVEKVERTRVVEVLLALRKPAAAARPRRDAASGWPSLCLVATMFFSAAEMAFIAANRLRLRHLAEEAAPSGRAVPRGLPAARARAVDGHDGGDHGPHHRGLGGDLGPARPCSAALRAAGASPLVLTPLMLVFGEIIPKAVAREWATSLILRLYRPLTWAAVLAGAVRGVRQRRGRRALLRPVGGRQPDTPRVRLARGAEGAAADGAGRGRRDHPGSRDDRQDLRPRRHHACARSWSRWSRSRHAAGDRRARRTRSRSSTRARVLADPDLPRARDQRGGRGDGHGSAAAAARRRATLRRADAPAVTIVPETKRIDDLLREMQRAPHPPGRGRRRVRRRHRHRHPRGHPRGDRRRDPRTSTTARRRRSSGCPTGAIWVAARTNIDELNEALDWNAAQAGLRDRSPVSCSPPLHRIPRRGRGVPDPGIRDHRAGGGQPARSRPVRIASGGGRARRTRRPAPRGHDSRPTRRRQIMAGTMVEFPTNGTHDRRVPGDAGQRQGAAASSSSRSGGASSATSRTSATASRPRVHARWPRTCTTARRPASPTARASSSWPSTSAQAEKDLRGAAHVSQARTRRRRRSAPWDSAWAASSRSSPPR